MNLSAASGLHISRLGVVSLVGLPFQNFVLNYMFPLSKLLLIENLHRNSSVQPFIDLPNLLPELSGHVLHLLLLHTLPHIGLCCFLQELIQIDSVLKLTIVEFLHIRNGRYVFEILNLGSRIHALVADAVMRRASTGWRVHRW